MNSIVTYSVSSTPNKSPKGYLSKRQLSNSLRWLIYVINSVDNTKLPYYPVTLPPTQHHSFFRNLPPLTHD